MARDYESDFSNPENSFHISIKTSIENECKKFIPNFRSLESIEFKSGSTIVDYSVRAPTFTNVDVGSMTSGIFTTLAKEYVMLSDSTKNLEFDPPEVFLGSKVDVICGPPPPDLNLGTDWTAEWRRDGNLIVKDSEHDFSKPGGVAKLTVLKSYVTDDGSYECRLRKGNVVFREKSRGAFNFKKRPLIRVDPIIKKLLCGVAETVLKCFVQNPYRVSLFEEDNLNEAVAGPDSSIDYTLNIPNCDNRVYICQDETGTFEKSITLEFSDQFDCSDGLFGNGKDGERGFAVCPENKEGNQTAVCRRTEGGWVDFEDNCILQQVQELLEQSVDLNNNTLPVFLEELQEVTSNLTGQVLQSPSDINAIVNILSNIADASSDITITESSMTNLLLTVGVLTTDEAKESWDTLNGNTAEARSLTKSFIDERARSLTKTSRNGSASSTLLRSLEFVTKSLSNESFNIETPFILLNKTTYTGDFNADFNSSVEVDIPDIGRNNITVVTFASMDNVLPPRDERNLTSTVINGRVVLVYSSNTIENVTFTFDTLQEEANNKTLGNPQCVFWNFSLFNNLGGWDNEGCEVISENETITCNCNHLTSFSILMSPYTPIALAAKIITYIGVGISMASLVICLIIEAVIWRKIRRNHTSYLRHVCIVNIAVSLLIADIWFIVGAAINENGKDDQPACSTTTFFVHFFYLALFFWMLASGLLLLYRTVSVFDGGLSKRSMLAIGFCLGYGAPLIIVIITIAVTAPNDEYTRGPKVCWLNWDESKALLAFVIPALLIVVLNLLILLVVIYKMLRRRTMAAQAEEKHVLMVIARTLAVLTPIFGLTWGLGAGLLVDPKNDGIHISFAFFNSLQGFFILVFGTLLDKKVRSEIAIKSQTSSGTKTTSAGTSSSAGLGFFRNLARGRDGYNLSSSDNSTSNT